MHHDAAKYSVQTVEKAMALLGILADDGAQAIHVLADKLETSRNKTFRIIMTLENLGLIQQISPGSDYCIGSAGVVLAQKVLKNSSIIRHAHPLMEELAKRHGEAVYMTVMEGQEILFIDVVDCRQQDSAVALIGKRFPFFNTAAGKVIKALESKDLHKRLFRGSQRQQAIPNFKRFESELDIIRKNGVAVDIGVLGEGVISVAVAVRDYAGKVVGAITMLGPSFRMMKDRLEGEIIPSLIECGEIISGKFGYARICISTGGE